MDGILNSLINNLDYFVLLFIRITALILSSPIFGRNNIPNIAKAGLCLSISYIMFVAMPVHALEIRNILEYAMMAVKEVLFGVVMGYVTQLFFSLVQTAGYIIDMQMGFGMVNVFDVQNNINVPVTGNLLYVMLTLIFFGVNAHHQLILILFSTLENVPIGQVQLNAYLGVAALEVFIKSFLMAINVAMPFIGAGLLLEVVLGFIVRTTPQMNVFVVGMPLKVLLGFIMIIMVLPVYVRYTNTIFSEMFSAISYMLRGLAGAG